MTENSPSLREPWERYEGPDGREWVRMSAVEYWARINESAGVTDFAKGYAKGRQDTVEDAVRAVLSDLYRWGIAPDDDTAVSMIAAIRSVLTVH